MKKYNKLRRNEERVRRLPPSPKKATSQYDLIDSRTSALTLCWVSVNCEKRDVQRVGLVRSLQLQQQSGLKYRTFLQ